MLNWTRRITANGVIFYPPEGRQAGVLTVVERIRPVQRLRDLREQNVRRLTTPDGPPTISAAERFVTEEGEHAFTYELIGRAGPDTVLTAVGVIYGDDFFTRIVGFSTVPDMFDAFRRGVRYITRTMPVGLGIDRRRRYEYDAPPGWQPLVKPHSVSWYHPEFPRNRSIIRVYDTKPPTSSPSTLLDKRLFEDPQNDLHSVIDGTVFECTTDTGLSGAYELIRGNSQEGVESVVARVFLADTRYAYSLRLEASEPDVKASSAVFEAAVRSVVPIYLPAKGDQPEEKSGAALIHWVG